jgi:large subunit ribosomal protein L18
VRVRKVVVGTTSRPRLNVFKSISGIYAQVIDDSEGNTLISASTVDNELREKVKGMKKTEQAKVIGKAVAERAKSKGITSVVFDRGGFRYVGRIKALADGAREGNGCALRVSRYCVTGERYGRKEIW